MKHVKGGLVWSWLWSQLYHNSTNYSVLGIYSTCPHVYHLLSLHMSHVRPVQIQEFPSSQGKRTGDHLVGFALNPPDSSFLLSTSTRHSLLFVLSNQALVWSTSTSNGAGAPGTHTGTVCLVPSHLVNVPCRSFSVVGVVGISPLRLYQV